MIVYISGAYTADTKEQIEENILIAESFAIKIWNLGHSVFCAHCNAALFENKGSKASYSHILDFDKKMLCACEAIFMLPNWKNSNGASQEFELAKRIGMPIYHSLEEIPKEQYPDYLETLLKYYDEFISIERQRIIKNAPKYKDDWKTKDSIKEAKDEMYDMAGYAALEWAKNRYREDNLKNKI